MQSDGAAVSRPQRTHPLTVIGGFAMVAFGVLFSVVLAEGGFQIAIAVFGAFQVVGWWFKTYELAADRLVVRQGVFSRREQVVPFRRVQQVDIRRSLLMRVFGLAALKIETAGSQEGTVSLSALDTRTAERLRAVVLAGRDAAAEPPRETEAEAAYRPPGTQTRDVYALTGERLVVAGATSALPVTMAALAAVVALPGAVAALVADARYVLVPLLAGGLVVVAAVVSVVNTVLMHGGYRLTLERDDIRLEHGVLDKRHVSMPRARVQHITITDNPARRALGVVSVQIRSAAVIGGGGGRDNGGTGRLDIPLVPREHSAPLVAALMGDATWTPPPLVPRPPAALRRGVRRRVMVVAVPALVVVAWVPALGIAGLVMSSVGIPWGRAAHRYAGHGTTDSVVAVGAGVVSHSVHVVPLGRVQSARTAASPLQRRAHLTTILLDVAGSSNAPSLYDVDADQARELRRGLPRASSRHRSTTISPTMP